MTRETLRAALAGLFVVGLAVQLNAASLEEIEKKIIEASEKIQSYTADLAMVMDTDQHGMTMKSVGKGTMEYMRKGDTALMRSEYEATMTMKFGDQEQKMEQKMLTIMDGEHVYALTDNGLQKSAVKTKLDPAQKPVASKEMFETLRKDADVKVLDDEKVDGKDCYVLEITPKEKDETTGKSKSWYAKDSGIMVKMVTMSPDGKPVHTMTVSNIKLDAKIDAERFKFKAPDGVEVVDMTAVGETPPAAPPREKE